MKTLLTPADVATADSRDFELLDEVVQSGVALRQAETLAAQIEERARLRARRMVLSAQERFVSAQAALRESRELEAA
jgi:hypothetical protein